MSSEQICLQDPPKLFRVNSWINRTVNSRLLELDTHIGHCSSTYRMPSVTGDAAAATCDCMAEADSACVLATLIDDTLVNFAAELLPSSSAANYTHTNHQH